MSDQVELVDGSGTDGGGAVTADDPRRDGAVSQRPVGETVPGQAPPSEATSGRSPDRAGRNQAGGGPAGAGQPGGTIRGGGRPTMKDVAARAGVALKTVSRVVNGEPGVTPETAQRVLGAIEALGFRRNESARLLRTGRTATLGFIADSWADPDRAAVYMGLENIAREHGFLLYSGSTGSDADREERLALAMCARRVDGLVIIPTPGAHDYLVSEIEAGVATVFVLRRPPELVQADAVLPDERAAARAAVMHLVTQGHHRIGFLGDPAGYPSQTLRERFAEAMSTAGLAAEPGWLTLTAGDLAAPGLPVTAVFCASQRQTRAALRALPPESPVALVGFGDFELADLVATPVTVVSYDPVQIGYTAGELLLRRLGGEQGPARVVEVPVTLISRGPAGVR
jgi:LacI family transcriptional regulator